MSSRRALMGLSLGKRIGQKGGASGGGPAALAVYAFLDLAGTADSVITPTILNNSMKGAVPGTWALDDCRHSGVVATPGSLNHTILRAQTSYDLVPSVTCDGETFTAVTRKIENDKGEAVAATDYENVKWTPGEVIEENFMAAFCYETNRSLGADTGGLSIDPINLGFGGNGVIFQIQMDAGSVMVARAHGGQKVPISNNIRYRVQLLADLDGSRAEFWIKNDATGDFIGAGGDAYLDGTGLNAVHTGDYLTNGDGTQGISGLYFQKGVAAVFSSFALPAVTDLEFVQTGVDVGTLSFNSGALSFLIEKNTDGAGFVTLEANYRSSRASIANAVEYEDTTVADGESVVYRVTAKVRQVTSSATTSDAVVIDNSSQPLLQDNFDAYSDSTALGDTANWIEVGSGGGVQVLKTGGDGRVTTASGSTIGNCYYNQAISANMRVEATIKTVAAGGGFDWVGPGVRTQAGANTGYGLIFSSTDLYLISIVAGTQTTIMSDTGMTLAVGDRLALEVTGVGAATRLKAQVDTGSGWVDKWTDVNPGADIDGGFASIISWLLSGGNALDEWKAFEL